MLSELWEIVGLLSWVVWLCTRCTAMILTHMLYLTYIVWPSQSAVKQLTHQQYHQTLPSSQYGIPMLRIPSWIAHWNINPETPLGKYSNKKSSLCTIQYRLGVARPFLMLKALFFTLPLKLPSKHWSWGIRYLRPPAAPPAAWILMSVVTVQTSHSWCVT